MEMIFVNAILIHLQRNIISLAYLGESSFNRLYLAALGVILFLIYLYYRIRIRSEAVPKGPGAGAALWM